MSFHESIRSFVHDAIRTESSYFGQPRVEYVMHAHLAFSDVSLCKYNSKSLATQYFHYLQKGNTSFTLWLYILLILLIHLSFLTNEVQSSSSLFKDCLERKKSQSACNIHYLKQNHTFTLNDCNFKSKHFKWSQARDILTK